MTIAIRRAERIADGAKPGMALGASWVNRVARVINDKVLNAPRDLDGGTEGDVAEKVLTEQSRTTTTVRVENPDDAEQWVDVARIDQVAFLEDGNGQRWRLIFVNPVTE